MDPNIRVTDAVSMGHATRLFGPSHREGAICAPCSALSASPIAGPRLWRSHLRGEWFWLQTLGPRQVRPARRFASMYPCGNSIMKISLADAMASLTHKLGTGSYVANRVSDKISMLADNVFICRSGSVRTHADGALLAFEVFSVAPRCNARPRFRRRPTRRPSRRTCAIT